MIWDLSIFSEWFSPGRCVWSSFSIGPTPRRHPRTHATPTRSITHHHTHVPHPGPAGGNPALLANHLQVTSRNHNRTHSRLHFGMLNEQTFPSSNPSRRSRNRFPASIPWARTRDACLWSHLWTWPCPHAGATPGYFFGSIEPLLIPNELRRLTSVHIQLSSHLWT